MSKSIFIAGANGGMGSVLVKELVGKGWIIYAGVYRDASQLPKDPRIQLVKIDVTDQQSVKKAAEYVAQLQGEAGLQAVVNLAGMPASGPLEVVSDASMRKIFDVNFFGPLTVMREFTPLVRLGKGRIVNVTGALDRLPLPVLGPVCASKTALSVASDVARQELAKWKIPVITVEPSGMKTAAIAKTNDAFKHALDEASANQRDLYEPVVSAMARATASQPASPVETVVGVLVKALESSRPKPHYLAGRGAHAVALLGRIPVRMRDVMVRRAMKLDA